MRRTLLGLAIALLPAACSPFSGGEAFNCVGDGECNANGPGRCIADNSGLMYCAYPDSDCTTDNGAGYAFGDSAGPNSNRCVTGGGGGPGGPTPDAPPEMVTIDSFVPLPDAKTEECLGDPGSLRVCFPIELAGSDRTFPPDDGHLYSHGDNNVHSDCDGPGSADGLSLCVIGGNNMTFSDQTFLEDPSGNYPMVFAAAGTITIDATVYATGSIGNKYGPPGAATNPGCGSLDGHDSQDGTGGGAGGSYGTPGGNGGDGGGGAQGGQASPEPGAGSAIMAGCPGGHSGFVQDQIFQVASGGGRSGGVVYLIAAKGIIITKNGSLRVNGGGGAGGQVETLGGGGAGTGGFVGIDTPSLMLTNAISANGGGGGGGADLDKIIGEGRNQEQVPQSGVDGADGSTQLPAKGGPGGGGGGIGGNGPDNPTHPGTNGTSGKVKAGGGGGGGGEGIIWVVGQPMGLDPAKLSGVVIMRPPSQQ